MDKLEQIDSIGVKLVRLREKLEARKGEFAYRDSIPMIEAQIAALEQSRIKIKAEENPSDL